MTKAFLTPFGAVCALLLSAPPEASAQSVPAFLPDSSVTYSISPAAASSSCIDVAGASINQGASVIAWQCLGVASANQQWSVIPVTSPAGSGVQLVSKNSGECLDIAGSSMNDGGYALQWPCGGATKLNQVWKLVPGVGGYQLLSLNSGKCLNIPASKGSTLTQQSCTSSSTQMWNLNTPSAPIRQGLYQFALAVHPSSCVGIAGASLSLGASANTTQCSSSSSAGQQWNLISITNGVNAFQLVSQNSNLCLDVSGQSTSDGAAVLQWTCGGSSKLNQIWTMTAVGTSYQISSLNSGKCLNVPGGQAIQLEQRSCDGSATQLWTATQVSAVMPAALNTTTSLQVMPTQALTGQTVVLSAAVTATASGATGTMTFLDGTTILASVPVGSQGQASYSTSSLGNGTHQLTATYSSTNGRLTSQSLVATATVAEPSTGEQALQADSFVDSVGVNTHFSYTNTSYFTQFPNVLAKLSASGLRHVRDGFYNWSATDPIVAEHQALASAGIGTDYVVPINAATSPSVLAAFATLVGDFESAESANECDAGTNCGGGGLIGINNVVGMLPVLSTAATSMKVPAIGPSFTTAYAYVAAGSLSAVITANNLHVYFGGRNPGTIGWGDGDGRGNNYGSIDWWIAQGSVPAANKPSMITETGYLVNSNPLPYTLPEAVESYYLTRTLLLAFSKGIRKTYVYELLEEPSSPGYGLLRNDLSERPAFTAISALLNLLKDYGSSFTPGKLDYTISGSTQPSHVLLQKHDGTFWLALWMERSCYDVVNAATIPTSDVNVTITVNGGEAIKTVLRFDQTGLLHGQLLAGPTTATQVAVGDSLTLIQLSPQ